MSKAISAAERIEELLSQRLEVNDQMQAINALAESEDGRDFTDEELANLDNLSAEYERLSDLIARKEKIQAYAKEQQETFGRKSEPQNVDPQNHATQRQQQSKRQTRIELLEDKGKWGWKHLGDFASAVRIASTNAGSIDPRLIANAPSTWSSEGVGADGGFAVPPDFRTAIVEKVMGEDSLLGMTDQMTTESNSMTFPKDETTDWDATGGIQAYWEGEGSQLTQSKISLQEESLRLNKLTALIPVTEELMDDASGLDSYLRRRVPRKFDYKIQDAIVNGSGVGKPTGFMNSSALVSVAKESGQTADTVLFANIVKMWSRVYAPSRQTGVWLINQDVEPQLLQMAFDPAATAGTVPAYMPANGASGTPYSTLMGRPVMPIQAMQTLGDLGDIAFVDLSQYLTVTKVGGVRSDVSIHLFFDYDMAAFRFIMRIAGKPWWSAPITPANSTNTLSAFVTLAERA